MHTVYILRRYVSIVVDITNLDKDFELFLSFEFLHYHLLRYFSFEVNDVDVDNEIIHDVILELQLRVLRLAVNIDILFLIHFHILGINEDISVQVLLLPIINDCNLKIEEKKKRMFLLQIFSCF